MNIELKPVPNRRGQRSILVDGVQWGSVHMESMGPRGVSYYFRENATATYIRRPDPKVLDGLLAVVNSQKPRNRQELEAFVPTETRIKQEAERLIAEGLLRHPDDVAKAAVALRERNAARHKEVKEQEDRLFLNRAQEAMPLDISNKLLHFQREILITEIIKAMRWAQHQ